MVPRANSGYYGWKECWPQAENWSEIINFIDFKQELNSLKLNFLQKLPKCVSQLKGKNMFELDVSDSDIVSLNNILSHLPQPNISRRGLLFWDGHDRMADEFAEHLLVSSLAQMCKQQGWHQASRSGLSLFADLARHYVRNIGIISLRYSLHAGRFEADLDDLGNAMSELGISLSELQNFWSETEPNRGLPQVCNFPAPVTLQLNIPEGPRTVAEPSHIPDYLPVLKQQPPPLEEDKTVKEDCTIVNKSSSDRTPDPFDVAAAAPAPSAPNFPFVNKTDIPVPTISSWGFQRVTIDTKTSSSQPEGTVTSQSKPCTPTDNFHISENSDDFVFASKHSKPKEEKKAPPKSEINVEDVKETKTDDAVSESLKFDNTANGSTLVENNVSSDSMSKTSNSNHIDCEVFPEEKHVSSKSLFFPSLGTSTPLVATKKDVPMRENGLSCQQKLFKDISKPEDNHEDEVVTTFNITEVKETESADAVVIPMATNKSPNYKVDDFMNDFDSDGSGFDDMTSKENVERLIKPISPLAKPNSPVINNLTKSPQSKRRKLDSPSSTPPLDKTLLKNRPDLIRDDNSIKQKSECKLTSNHTPNNKLSQNKLIKKHKKEKSSSVTAVTKLKPVITENNHSHRHKFSKKNKKKEAPQPIDLFGDGPIRLPDNKHDKLKIISKSEAADIKGANKASVPPPSTEFCQPKIEPLKLPIPKKDVNSVSHKDNNIKSAEVKSIKVAKIELAKEKEPKMENFPSKPSNYENPSSEEKSSTSIKISLKTVKNSKYKSKSTVDTEDDLSSLSSDSLEGFRDLLPKKAGKVKKSSENKSNKRTFKTKAELKNPWPSSAPLSSLPEEVPTKADPPKEVEKKKKTGGLTTKIKIAKPVVSTSPKPKMNSPKTSVKLKLPNPALAEVALDTTVSSVYSQPSLMIDESFDKKPLEDSIVATTLKIPKIKIKIAGSHMTNDCPSSPNMSFSSSFLTSPEKPAPKAAILPSKTVSSKAIPPLKVSSTKPKIHATSKTPKAANSIAKEVLSTPKLVLSAPKPNPPNKMNHSANQDNQNSSKSVSSKTDKITSKASLPAPKSIPALKIKLPDPGNVSIQPEIFEMSEDIPVLQKDKKEKKSKKLKIEKKSSKSTEKNSKKVSIKEKPKIDAPDVVLIPDDPIVPGEVESLESTLVSETVMSETVAQSGGEAPMKVWYCPTCMLPDDGSPMVGCDKCDEWYHWPCVGLVQAPPDDCDWFCPPCTNLRNKPSSKGRKPGAKRKRKT